MVDLYERAEQLRNEIYDRESDIECLEWDIDGIYSEIDSHYKDIEKLNAALDSVREQIREREEKYNDPDQEELF